MRFVYTSCACLSKKKKKTKAFGEFNTSDAFLIGISRMIAPALDLPLQGGYQKDWLSWIRLNF